MEKAVRSTIGGGGGTLGSRLHALLGGIQLAGLTGHGLVGTTGRSVSYRDDPPFVLQPSAAQTEARAPRHGQPLWRYVEQEDPSAGSSPHGRTWLSGNGAVACLEECGGTTA
jgi:hypothetical protein